MPKVNIICVALAGFFLLSFSIRAGYSTEPVVIEFFYYDPSTHPLWCSTCPSWQLIYATFLHNNETVNRIQNDYGDRVSVKWIYFDSSYGQEKIEQYNIVQWNSMAINYEVMIEGIFNETYIREIIDAYLSPPPLHDVAVLSVVPSSSSVRVGETLDINVTVKNEGNRVESFNVTVYYDSNIIEAFFVDGLEPDAESVLVFHWDTQNVTEGNYTISAQAETVQNETDIVDNLRYDGVVEVRALSTSPTIRRDVAVISVVPSQSVVNVGEKVNITVAVKNVGTEAESFSVSTYYDDFLFGTSSVANLDPGRELSLIFVWDITNQTAGNYTIKARAEPVANETNLGDNLYIYGKVQVTTPQPAPSHHPNPSPSPASLSFTAVLMQAFSFGFLETFSPCLIIMLSFILSYTIGEVTQFKKSFSKVMLFGIGFVSAAVLLGLAFGLVLLSMPALQISLTWIVCIFAIFFGLNLLGLLKVPFQTKSIVKKLARKYVITFTGIFILGFIFYFLDPCIAPIFISMVPLLFLDFLPVILFVFSLGTIIPFIGIGIFAGSVSKLVRSTYRHRFKIRAISGSILIGYATYLIVSYLLPKLIR